MDPQFRSRQFPFAGNTKTPLDQVLRQAWPEASWGAVRKLITTGKVAIDGVVTTNPRDLVTPKQVIELSMTRPKTKPGFHTENNRVLYSDPHVVVVNKPPGIASVEHAAEPTSLQTQIRAWLEQKERKRLPPLRVVHRLDKVTSGIMLFARSHAAQADLKAQFRAHVTGRIYLGVAYGNVPSQTLSFQLVRDRGDGYRGVTTNPQLGRRSVTHIKAKEQLRRCTLVECTLETGRTHQIRIHLAEIGHPLVGEPLYIKDYRGPKLESSQTLLHAASLSFTHPVFRTTLRYEQPLPDYVQAFLAAERTVR